MLGTYDRYKQEAYDRFRQEMERLEQKRRGQPQNILPCDLPRCGVCQQIGRSISVMAGIPAHVVRQAMKDTMRGIDGQ